MQRKVVLVALVLAVLLALPAEASRPPSRQIAALKRQVASLKARVVRLEAEGKLLGAADTRLRRENAALAERVVSVDPCPITTPNGSPPPGSTFGSAFHGNGTIWVGMWRSNVVVAEPDRDGSIAAKFGWWRGVPGRLRIEGTRLDAAAPPLRSDVPDGYGDQGFQATGIIFPTEGCWQVTGRVGDASLSFVTLVLKS